MKTSIAHLLHSYLFITGSWIYGQLVNASKYRPIVFARQTENLDIFPFSPIYSLSDLSYPHAFVNRGFKKIFGIFPHYEKLIRNNQVQLLHAHFGQVGVHWLSVKKRTKLPLITAFYGSDASKQAQEEWWRTQYLKLFQHGELFLAEGSNMKQRLVELGCPEEKVVIQHLGVDLDKFSYKPRQISDDGKIRVLICSSFREKKGIPYAIQAFANVRQKHSNIELIIIGDGEMRDEIESLIRDLNIGDHVKLLGYQPHSVFLKESMNCHLFLAPSVTAQDGDTEGGAPVVLLEVQATGMPVISTFHADIPEVVLDGKSGFLVNERDVDALAERLDYLVEHPEVWPIIGKNGREHVNSEYNVKTQVNRLEEIYASSVVEILSGKQGFAQKLLTYLKQ